MSVYLTSSAEIKIYVNVNNALQQNI